jgi:adenosylhomocysteine nucleosidase
MSSQAFDVGLIIPLAEEFDIAREILSFEDPVTERGHYFYPFSVPGCPVRGIATVLFDMGLAASAAVATQMLSMFDLRLLALVGIAGALDPELYLGDVVIASSVDEYMHAARARPGERGREFEFERGSVSWQASPEMVSFVRNFRYVGGTEDSYRAWAERSASRREPGRSGGTALSARERPEYRVGQIATGDIVSAASSFAQWIRRNDRKRLAVEMEAGGVARAIYGYGRNDLLVIRGVSDFSDERKHAMDTAGATASQSGGWRRYAMLNAVDMLATLVAHPRFPWPSSSVAARSKDSPEHEPRRAPMIAWAAGNAQINQAGGDINIGR